MILFVEIVRGLDYQLTENYIRVFFSDLGFDIKSTLDSDDDKLLKDKIMQIWGNRSDQYSQIRFDTKKKKPTKKIEMYAIGG